MPSPHRPNESGDSRAGRHWPWAIAIGLGLVVLANATFVYLALTHPDPVAASYSSEKR